MRKQELVHLHVLCSEVRSHIEAEHGLSEEAFERYEEFGVPPTAIHESKASHRGALDRLLDEIDDVVEPRQATELGHASTN